MKGTVSLLIACLSVALVRAQTQTVVDAAGETVVEVITIDPNLGVPSTLTLSTLTGLATTTTTPVLPTTTTTPALPTTTTTENAGPIVGQPAATVTGETTYIYTTTDALGNQVVSTDTFTPSTIPDTVTPQVTFTGTILDYSSWLSMVGTNTVAADTSSGAAHVISSSACAVGAAFIAGALSGAGILFL